MTFFFIAGFDEIEILLANKVWKLNHNMLLLYVIIIKKLATVKWYFYFFLVIVLSLILSGQSEQKKCIFNSILNLIQC